MRLLAALISLVLWTACPAQDMLLHPGGTPPAHGEVLPLDTEPPPEPSPSTLLSRTIGNLGVLEGDALAGLARLRPVLARSTDPAVSQARPVRSLAIWSRRGRQVIDLLLTPDGRLVLKERVPSGRMARVAFVDRPPIERLLTQPGHYLGAAQEPEVPRGEVFEVPQPYTPGWEVLTSERMNERMFRGMHVRVLPSQRDLADEQFLCRLPSSYDPARPPGLLVWVDPSDLGDPPFALHAACDELNLAIVGVRDASNDRLVVDRMQLALDSVATICDRFPIDESRIYLTGMSGGGRVSSMLWSAFPDIFAGAVPIVGLNHYRQVTIAGKRLAAGFGRPRGNQARLLKTRRLAVMTGPLDFNYEEMKERARQLAADGFAVRFLEYPDMGHTMPRPDRFFDAIAWVDEPQRRAREEREQRAAALLERVREQIPHASPRQRRTIREQLIEVTRLSPWGEAGRTALDLLEKLEREADRERSRHPPA